MAYFPKVNIPNTFYVNAGAPSGGGSKGNPTSPYATPWDIAGDLGSASEIIRLSPGTFLKDDGVFDANNQHTPNSNQTTFMAHGVEIFVEDVDAGSASFFSDRTGAGTDETRVLRLIGGKYEYSSVINNVYGLEFINADSYVQMDIEYIIGDGPNTYGIAIGGDLKGSVDLISTIGGRAIHFLPGSDGTGSQLTTTGREVDVKVGKFISSGDGAVQAFGWTNDGAEYVEVDAFVNVEVGTVETTDRIRVFSMEIDGITNSKFRFKASTLIVNPLDNNRFFNLEPYWGGPLPVTDSSILVELDETEEFSGALVSISDVTLDNSLIHVKIGKATLTTQAGSSSFISIGGSVVLTNNSTLIIEVDELVHNSGASSSILYFGGSSVSTDATSKIIVRGNYITTSAIPLISVGTNNINLILQDVVLENDGTVAAIQRDSTATPTVNVAGTFDASTIIADPNVTINKYDEYV